MKSSPLHHPVALVTGAAGFIGANLVRSLVADGIDVHALVRPESSLWRLDGIRRSIHIHKTGLSDRNRLRKLMETVRPDDIFHLAAHGAYHTQTDADTIIATDLVDFWNLVSVARDIPYRSFVATGSSAEYGKKMRPMRETDALSPLTFYAAAKAGATALATVAAHLWGKPIVTVRPFSIYGPMEEHSRFIPTVIKNLTDKKPVELTGETLRHDWVFVDDAVSCFRRAARMAEKFPGEVFNIGSGKEWTNRQVIREIASILGVKPEIQIGAYVARSWDNVHWIADTDKTERCLGWKAKTPFPEGLKTTVEWMRNHSEL